MSGTQAVVFDSIRSPRGKAKASGALHAIKPTEKAMVPFDDLKERLLFIDGYPGGVAGFVHRARELAAAHGDRFAPPSVLTSNAGDAGTGAESTASATAS